MNTGAGPPRYRRILILDPPALINRSTHPRNVWLECMIRPQVPYGGLMFATYLARRGIETRVVSLDSFLFSESGDVRQHDGSPSSAISLSYALKDVLDTLVTTYRPDLIGLSVTGIVKEYSTRMIIRILRKTHPELPIVVGGHQARAHPARFFRSSEVPDCVVSDSGFDSFPRWAAKAPGADLPVEGCVVLSKKGPVSAPHRRTPEAGVASNLSIDYGLLWTPETFPFAAFDHTVVLGLGCVERCYGCSVRKMWPREPLIRPLEKIGEELDALRLRGVTTVGIGDSHIVFNPAHFESLCGFLSEQQPLRFIAQARSDGISEMEMKRIARARLAQLHIRLATHDGADGPRLSRLLSVLNDEGVAAGLWVMIGHPLEGPRQDPHSYRTAEGLVASGSLKNFLVHCFVPYDTATDRPPKMIRLHVTHTGEWTGRHPLHSVLDRSGAVVYARETIAQLFGRMLELERCSRVNAVPAASIRA